MKPKGNFLRKDFYIIENPTNTSKIFFIILSKTNFGKERCTVRDVTEEFFRARIKKVTEGYEMRNKVIDKKFYNRSHAAEVWRYVYPLEEHGFISIRRAKGREMTINIIEQNVHAHFLSAVLDNLPIDAKKFRKNGSLRELMLEFNSIKSSIFSIPLNEIFDEDEIKNFIAFDVTRNKRIAEVKNPFHSAVRRFCETSHLAYDELTSSVLKHKKKIKSILELKKRIRPYLKAILIFSSLFGKDYVSYTPFYNFEESSKKEVEKEFDKLCGNDMNSEREEITKLHCEEYWKNVVKPLIEIKREYYNFIERLKEKDIVEAVDILDNYEDDYGQFDMTFPSFEDEVKEKREILEKIKKRYGF